MYQSGVRSEEFFDLPNADMGVDSKGVFFMLRGKIEERR